MKNILNLRKGKVKIIETTVYEKPTAKREFSKVLIGILVVSLITLGITKANDFIFENEYENARENFSILGNVVEIVEDTLILNSISQDSDENTPYEININKLEYIQASNYNRLLITDVNVGDKIIVQGLTNGKIYFAKRIISFTVTESDLIELAEEVATTTLDVASTTDENASSTDETSTDGVDSGSNSDENATTTVDTATTTEEIATTTDESATIIEDVIEEVSTSTESEPVTETPAEENADQTGESSETVELADETEEPEPESEPEPVVEAESLTE
jgi:hypothetical protein